MKTSDESFRERLAEAIAEAHTLDHSVDAVMRVIDEERRELRRLRLSIRCECPWMDGEVHLDPNCLVHQRMD